MILCMNDTKRGGGTQGPVSFSAKPSGGTVGVVVVVVVIGPVAVCIQNVISNKVASETVI